MVSFRSETLRGVTMALCAVALASGGAAFAQSDKSASDKASSASSAPTKPVTDNNPDAKSVAETPLTDLNVKKGEIPPILLRAQAAPYSLAGLKSCPSIVREVGGLNSVLGDDVDIAKGGKRNTSAGHVAQSVVGSFIPFQGVIREVSGASAEQRKLEAVIRAGMARRGFLKGVGLSRGCRYPARPG
jgi:hypothetical protein